MKTMTIFILIVSVTLLIFNNLAAKEDFPVLKGPYLGQKPPGKIPGIFAPGFISTEKRELNSVFSPDGKEFYYAISFPGKGYKMYFTKELKNGWKQPRPVPFLSNKSDVDMCITHDGKRMYFGSNRPVNGVAQDDFKIWHVDRMGNNINSNKTDYCPMISPDNKYFFFTSTRTGNGDIYWVDAKIIEELRPDELKRGGCSFEK